MWKCLVQDLNSCCRVHFLRRLPLYHGHLLLWTPTHGHTNFDQPEKPEISSALCGHWIPLRGLAKSESRWCVCVCVRERERGDLKVSMLIMMMLAHTHTHTHTHIYIYIYIYIKDCNENWRYEKKGEDYKNDGEMICHRDIYPTPLARTWFDTASVFKRKKEGLKVNFSSTKLVA